MSTEDKTLPHVLIVGGGIGGLTLAILLERAGISYQIFEKASQFKPLGSAISLSSQVFTFLSQLGLYDQLCAVSKPFQDLNIHTFNPTSKTPLKFKGTYAHGVDETENFRFETRMMARPDLCNILLSHVPRDKILMSKRILSIQQNKEGVMIRASDNTTFHGDICVGADGCFSPVRQSMYQEVERKKLLPVGDGLPINYDADCVVGVTKPLDPNKFHDLTAEKSTIQVVLFKKQPVSIWLMPLTHFRVGWMINELIPKEKGASLFKKSEEGTNFRFSEWGPEAAVEMCERFRDHPTTLGGTFGDLLDNTPKELISKVMLEEKFFETWQDGRTCLIGDACHKTLPFGAQGATNAMLDALALANRLYDIPSNSYHDIRDVLQDYESQRKAYGKIAVESSTGAGKLFHTRGIIGDSIRHLVLKMLPQSLYRVGYIKVMQYRPQVSFLPFLENTGSAKKLPQEYAKRYLKEKAVAERRASKDPIAL